METVAYMFAKDGHLLDFFFLIFFFLEKKSLLTKVMAPSHGKFPHEFATTPQSICASLKHNLIV